MMRLIIIIGSFVLVYLIAYKNGYAKGFLKAIKCNSELKITDKDVKEFEKIFKND